MTVMQFRSRQVQQADSIEDAADPKSVPTSQGAIEAQQEDLEEFWGDFSKHPEMLRQDEAKVILSMRTKFASDGVLTFEEFQTVRDLYREYQFRLAAEEDDLFEFFDANRCRMSRASLEFVSGVREFFELNMYVTKKQRECLRRTRRDLERGRS